MVDVALLDETEMAGPADITSQGWFAFLTTDVESVGIVGWVGTVTGIVSLVVTIAGFVLALRQLQKVQDAAVAAQEAVTTMKRVVTRQEISANLSEARSHLKLAKALMINNLGAAGAYIDTSCSFLTQAHHLRGGGGEDVLFVHLIKLREIVSLLQSEPLPQLSLTRSRKMYNDVNAATITVDILIAQVKYDSIM